MLQSKRHGSTRAPPLPASGWETGSDYRDSTDDFWFNWLRVGRVGEDDRNALHLTSVPWC